MKSTARSSGRWMRVTGSGSRKTPVEKLSLAAEVFVVHKRFDERRVLPADAGLMVNRHIWRKRFIKPPRMLGRNAPGEDRSPTGAYLSLASGPRGKDGLGGELAPRGRIDRRTRRQREWDFLAEHVRKAYQLYTAHRALINRSPAEWDSSPAYLQARLTNWEKAVALARYALQWKMRLRKVYTSFHPVDVMFHSSYCSGAANVLHALAMVAGFETRFISITNHSMVELFVDGRWVWADNHAQPGAITPAFHNYAEVTADPKGMVYLTAKQREYLSARAARYRSTYHYAGRYYWHFCWGSKIGRGARFDVRDGYGLSVPYDPSTAAALYPESKRHVFWVPRGWPPAVNVSEKGALVRASVPLRPGRQLRKRFFVAPSPDNPVVGGKVKLWVAGPVKPRAVQCALDGFALTCVGRGTRHKQRTVDFDVPAGRLTPGEHDLVVRASARGVRVVLYPDIVEPYCPPVLGAPWRVPDSAFSVEPCLGVKELEALREPF